MSTSEHKASVRQIAPQNPYMKAKIIKIIEKINDNSGPSNEGITAITNMIAPAIG